MYRIRKVKCDESRPSCHRCTSTGRICDGYGIWSGLKPGNRSVDAPKEPEISSPPVSLSIVTATAKEKQCFEWFRYRSVKKVQGIFVSRFWDTLVFQASIEEPAVLHAAIALGSIHRTAALDTELPHTNKTITKQHYGEEFTLQQYIKAISYLHPRFATANETSLRVALIACVLFICLEFFRGHFQTAQTHLKNGLKLLEEVRSLSSDATTRYLVERHHGGANEWITAALFRLYVQVGLFNQGHETGYIAFAPLYTHPCAPTFRTISEARQQLDQLTNRTVYLMGAGRQESNRMSAIRHEELLSDNIDLLSDLASWYNLYVHSKDILHGEQPVRNGFAYRILNMYYRLTSIIAQSCLSPTEGWIFDSLTDDFKSLLSTAITLRRSSKSASEALLGDMSDIGKSMADMGWIPPLYYTAVKCRVHRVRLQAIRLLESAPHKEGIWDGEILSRVARKVMEMEERDFYDNIDPGDDFLIGNYPEEKDFLLPMLPDSYRIHDVQVLLPDDPGGNIMLLCKRKMQDGRWSVLANEFDVLSQTWLQISGGIY